MDFFQLRKEHEAHVGAHVEGPNETQYWRVATRRIERVLRMAILKYCSARESVRAGLWCSRGLEEKVQSDAVFSKKHKITTS